MIFGTGVLMSIVLFSNAILFLLNNYQFMTMMFFLGLIVGGTYNFAKNIYINKKNIILMLVTTIIIMMLYINNYHNTYIIRNDFTDNIIFFLGGIIEIFASLVPGISGTSLLMMIGIYNHILKMISMIYNPIYFTNNINLYISYGIGMLVSFILNTYLITFLLKKYHHHFNIIVLGLSLASIVILSIMTFKISTTILELIIGIMLLVSGLLISCILDK